MREIKVPIKSSVKSGVFSVVAERSGREWKLKRSVVEADGKKFVVHENI